MRFQQNIDDRVSLTIPTVEVASDALTFTYVVVNGSPDRAFLVNQLFHRRGAAGFQVDSNLTYARVGPGPTLHLCKQLIEVPEDLDVEAPEVPYVTPVAPGSSFSETIRLEFPIGPHAPYRAQRRADEPYCASQFTFSLGYLLEDEPARATEVTLRSGTTHWRIDYTELLLRQRLKATGPIDAGVQVIASLRG